MGRPLYTNNAASSLAFGITTSDTSLQVVDGMGSLFPTPTSGDYFYCTLTSISTGALEIVKCTARSGDVFTVVRGQEGTTAQAYNMGDNVQLRITAAGMNFATGYYSQQQGYSISTQNQTLFTVPFTYELTGTNLYVFVNGSKQINTLNYTETTTTSITFLSGLNVGDIVEFVTA